MIVMEKLFTCQKIWREDSVSAFVIYIAPMSNRQRENDQPVLFDLTDQTIVTDSITPLTASVGCKSFSVDSWISTVHQIFFDPGFHYPLCIAVKFFKFSIKSCSGFYVIPHRLHSFQSSLIGRLLLPSATYSSYASWPMVTSYSSSIFSNSALLNASAME